MKNILIGLGLLAFILFGGLVVKILFFTPNSIDKSLEMAYEVTDETLDGKNAIYHYEWFKNREGEIESLHKKEVNAQLQLDDFLEMFPDKDNWTRDDKSEYARLRSNVTAVTNMLDSAIEDYNAKSSMVNRNIFKDNLPSNLSRGYYAGKKLRNN